MKYQINPFSDICPNKKILRTIIRTDYAVERALITLHPFRQYCLVIKNKSRKHSIEGFFLCFFQMVVKTFMDMDQDSEDEKQQYLPLALHLASEFFLRNPNKDVRLLVACCLADIFRIYAPEAPYTSHDKLKVKMLYKIKAFLMRKKIHTTTSQKKKPNQTPNKKTKPETQLKKFFFTFLLMFSFIKETLL